MASKKENKEGVLITELQNDKKLDKELKMEYISMARMYLKDFSVNIKLTSIEMNDKFYLGIDKWKEFLDYPVVRKYVKSFRDEAIEKVADSGLMEGDKGAVSIKKVAQESGAKVNNSNIVLIRLPEKVDWD